MNRGPQIAKAFISPTPEPNSRVIHVDLAPAPFRGSPKMSHRVDRALERMSGAVIISEASIFTGAFLIFLVQPVILGIKSCPGRH